MAILIIRQNNWEFSAELVRFNPEHIGAAEVAERWQRNSITYRVTGVLPSVTYKVAESNNIVDALIESARQKGGRCK